MSRAYYFLVMCQKNNVGRRLSPNSYTGSYHAPQVFPARPRSRDAEPTWAVMYSRIICSLRRSMNACLLMLLSLGPPSPASSANPLVAVVARIPPPRLRAVPGGGQSSGRALRQTKWRLRGNFTFGLCLQPQCNHGTSGCDVSTLVSHGWSSSVPELMRHDSDHVSTARERLVRGLICKSRWLDGSSESIDEI
jgi:hypothetical protein